MSDNVGYTPGSGATIAAERDALLADGTAEEV
jgi:hypothetical protein